MASIFRLGLGLLFPIGVALLALFDVRHLVDEMIASSHLDDRAMLIHRSEMHRGLYIRAMKRAKDEVADKYDGIAIKDAQNMVDAVGKGDLSFGANAVKQIGAPSVTKVTQVPPAQLRALPPGQSLPPVAPPSRRP